MRSHKKNLSKSIGENWRASSTCIAQNPKKKINFLSCKSNGERKLLSNQCNNDNDIIKLYLHGYICSYSIAKALRLSYNLY